MMGQKDEITTQELENIKIDAKTIADKEKIRMDYINKLSLEADEIVKSAGFSLEGHSEIDDKNFEKSVQDTDWSGQSSLDVSYLSTNSLKDVIQRKDLALGDIIALIIFAGIGRANHGEALDIFNLVGTASPFIIAWLLVSPFFGAYSRAATASISNVPKQLFLGWAVSVPIAIALRSLEKAAFPPTPFIVVTMISTFILLSAWRLLYILLAGETSDDEFRKAGFLEVFKMIGTLIRRW